MSEFMAFRHFIGGAADWQPHSHTASMAQNLACSKLSVAFVVLIASWVAEEMCHRDSL